MSVSLEESGYARAKIKKKMCIFCYKFVIGQAECNDVGSSKEDKNSDNDINKFIKLFERLVAVSRNETEITLQKLRDCALSENEEDDWARLGRCGDCAVIVQTFCDEYHQWRCLELQLEWRLKMLVDIMKSANRVPSRIRELTNLFKESEGEKPVDATSHTKRLANLKKSRYAIIKQCTKKLNKSTPRVALKRLEEGSGLYSLERERPIPLSSMKCENTGACDNSSRQLTTVDIANFLGWSMSFAAVALLASSTNGLWETGPTPTPEEISRAFSHGDMTIMDDFDTSDENEVLGDRARERDVEQDELCSSRNELGDYATEGKQVSFETGTNSTFHRAVTDAEVENDKCILNNIITIRSTSPSVENIRPVDQHAVDECIALEQNECINLDSDIESPASSNSKDTVEKQKSNKLTDFSDATIKINEYTEDDEKYLVANDHENNTSARNVLDEETNCTDDENMDEMDVSVESDFQQNTYTSSSSSSSEDEAESKLEVKAEIAVAKSLHRPSVNSSLFPYTVCSKAVTNATSLQTQMMEKHSPCSSKKMAMSSLSKKPEKKSKIVRYYHCKIFKTTLNKYKKPREQKTSKARKRKLNIFNKQKRIKKDKSLYRVTTKINKKVGKLALNDSGGITQEISPYAENSGTAEQQLIQISCPENVSNNEPERDSDRVADSLLYKILTGQVTTRNVQDKNEDTPPSVPPQRYSLRGNRKRSYRDMSLEDGEDDHDKDKNFHLGHQQNNTEDDDEYVSDQDTESSDLSSDVPEMDTDSDKGNIDKINQIWEGETAKTLKKRQRVRHSAGLRWMYTEKNGKFICNDCKKVFNTVHPMVSHLKNFHSLASKFICKVDSCRYRFKTMKNLEDHKKLHGTFKCNFCDVVKVYAPDLSLHEMEHAFRPEPTTKQPVEKFEMDVKTFNCPRCSFSCERESYYIKHHLKMHINLTSTSYTCPICNAEGMTCTFQQEHFKSHHKTDGLESSKIFKCDQCPAYFIKAYQINIHKMRIHNNGSNKCPVCSKTVSNHRSRLRYHMERVHPDHFFSLPFPCKVSVCKRRFPSQETLESHVQRVHKNNASEGVVKCSKCNKEFNGRTRLNAHMKAVHSVSSFICSECGRAFNTKEKLKRHMIYHNPDSWAFQCPSCGRKFADKYKLEIHQRTHTKEKPYVCQCCGEKYAHRPNWKNHMITKHPNVSSELETTNTRKGNYLSRKGSKKGDLITAGTSI